MKSWKRWSIVLVGLLAALVITTIIGIAASLESQVVNLADADWTWVGEDNGDWAGYFASPAGDVNGDGLGDLLVGAPMAGNKECPWPENPDGSCPGGLPKGEGIAYLILGRPQSEWPSDPMYLPDADASFLGCERNSMTARQLYTAGDVNGDGYDDILISGWKCGASYTGKAYLFLGRPDVEFWGSELPIEQADASFLGENEWDFLSYYVSTAGDVNNDGYDDFLITATHYEEDEPCAPGTPAEECGDCCRSFLDDAELVDSSTGFFTDTGSLNTGRIRHTATLLSSGEVLVAGGQNENSFHTSAELFDSTAGTWATTGSMSDARSKHTATLLQDDRVLVTGGHNDSGFLNSAELFDPGAGAFTITGSLDDERSGHTATLLSSGEVVVIGGQNDGGFLGSAELFDPTTGTFTTTGSLDDARSGHTATLLPDGTVLVTGGENDGGFLSSAELFDPGTGAFTPTGSLDGTRSGHTAVLLPDGRVLVTGGHNDSGVLHSAELFDPTTGAFITTGSLKNERSGHAAALMQDGSVLVIGGQNDSGSERSFELFDPDTDIWTSTVTDTLSPCPFDPMPDGSCPMLLWGEGRTDHTLTILPNGAPLVAGGRACTNFGKLYLILGREAADWGTDYPLALADASFLGEATEDRVGRSAAGVGDVNGDGFDDFLVGAISSDYGGENAGQNYLFLGRDENDPSWWGTNAAAITADASFVGESGPTIRPNGTLERTGDESGRRVAEAGDVNGDGLSDFLIGAALNDHGEDNRIYDAGIAHLILGRQAADWGLRYGLVNADASFIGEEREDQAGRRLNGVGDVNNDGYDDFVIGAPHNDRGGELAGTAYLIYGRPAADWGSYYPLGAANVIYVGKPDVGVAGYDMGWLDDFDGDGIDDFFIAAYGGRNNKDVPGDTYVLLGAEASVPVDAPVPFSFVPEPHLIPLDEWQRLDGEFLDIDGSDDFRSAELLLETPVDDSLRFHSRYDFTTDKFYLDDVNGAELPETCSPGDSVILSNGSVQLSCSRSFADVTGEHTVTVRWSVRWTPRPAQSTEFDVRLRSIDLSEGDSGFVDFGIWPSFERIFLPMLNK